jgi:hypothetical protein
MASSCFLHNFYEIVHERNFERHVFLADRHAPVTVAVGTEVWVLQALQVQEKSVRRILTSGTGRNSIVLIRAL